MADSRAPKPGKLNQMAVDVGGEKSSANLLHGFLLLTMIRYL
jgi:hypothetical protein